MQNQDHLNAVTSVFFLILTISAPHAENLARETTRFSLISLHAISVLVSPKNNKSKSNIDVSILENRRHRILILTKMILTYWEMTGMRFQVLKQTLRVLLPICFLHLPVPNPYVLNLYHLKTPQTVPPIPGTALQNKIESRLEKSLGAHFSIQQLMGVFQASMLEAMKSLPRSSTTVLGLDEEKGQQELRPRGRSAMLPLNPIIKDAFEKFEQDFLASNSPAVKYINPLASTARYYKVGQPCFEELHTDFAKICISPKPSGAPVGKVPLQVLKDLNIKLGRIFLPSILQLLSLGLPLSITLLWRSSSTASRLPSNGLKTKFKRVPIPKELLDVVMKAPVIILKS